VKRIYKMKFPFLHWHILEKMIMNKYIISILMLFILNGCFFYGLKEYAESSIGRKSYKSQLEVELLPSSSPCVQKWKNKGTKMEYYLDNGNLVHVYPGGCECLVHWEFDKKTELLVGYKFEGDRCSKL